MSFISLPIFPGEFRRSAGKATQGAAAAKLFFECLLSKLYPPSICLIDRKATLELITTFDGQKRTKRKFILAYDIDDPLFAKHILNR
jgi:hypothetical protein